MLVPDCVIYDILIWLPVMSLLRFKSVCKSWCASIESSDFIKHHLHHHHHDCDVGLKDEKNLIFCVPTDDPPMTFLLTPVPNYEVASACLQIDNSDLDEYFPMVPHDVSSFDGIVCFCFYRHWDRNICLWNPATKQSRLLPESPSPLVVEMEKSVPMFSVGFGFDVKTNDYKVVKLISNFYPHEKRVEVYSLKMNSWRNIYPVFPAEGFIHGSKIPFRNGNCYCWQALDSQGDFFFCFDFASETFHSIPCPETNDFPSYCTHICVVDDKIACVLSAIGGTSAQIWVFNDYGSPNESWARLYNIDPISTLEKNEMFMWLAFNANYFFFGLRDQLRRYNLLTEEANDISVLEFQQILKGRGLLNKCNFNHWEVVQYKESLLRF